MAETVASAVVAWLAEAGVGGIIGEVVGTVVYGAVTIGSAAAVSAAVGALTAPKTPDLTQEARQRKQTLRSPIEPRRVIWGTARVSGPMVYARITGSANEFAHMVIALHHGEVEDIGDVYIGERLSTDDRYAVTALEAVQATELTIGGTYAAGESLTLGFQAFPDPIVFTVSGAGSLNATVQALADAINVEPPFVGGTFSGTTVTASVPTAGVLRLTAQTVARGFTVSVSAGPSMSMTQVSFLVFQSGEPSLVRVNKHLGTADQTVDADLIAECTPDITSAHRLRGIAYIYLRYQFDINAFPQGLQGASAIVKGRKVYDPRTGATAWSNNFSLCVLDYLIGTVPTAAGDEPIGIGASLDEIDLASFSAAANICDETVATAAGGTVKRYTCDGSFQMETDPASMIEKMLPSGAATLVYTGGKYRLYVGAYTEPDVEITPDWLRGALTLTPYQQRRDLANGARGIFVDPAADYEPTDFPPQVVPAYVATDGELIYRDLRLDYVTSSATAQRLARLFVERGRRAATLQLPCNYNALRVALWQTVTLAVPALPNYSGAVFRVTGWRLVEQGGVDLTLQLEEAGAYAWSADQEKEGIAYSAPSLADPSTVGEPTGLTVTSDPLTTADGAVIPRLRATWAAPADAVGFELEYKRSADLFYTSGYPLGLVTVSYIAYLDAGVAYDIRLRALNVRGAASAWVEDTNTTAAGDTTPPAAPTALALSSPGAGQIKADCTAPSDTDTATVKFWRAATSGAASPTLMGTVFVLPGQAATYTESGIAAGTWYVRATAVDSSGNASSYSTEQNITI